ncbi:MAG: response regulator transcription factor [Actinobacteria bacterium]|nr:response regulator transcription factor [Actinomycetota bacterium]
MPAVLIVDDDLKLLKMLQRTLVYENLTVLTASNGEEALIVIDEKSPDLLIADWMMPKMDGLTLLRQLRAEKNKILVLMLTARDAIENRVDGLESGADDYLVKPFAPAELVARVHALLRRVEAKPEAQILEYTDLRLDPSTREARRGGLNLSLTLTEFNLLHLLLRHPRQVLERAQILREIWGYDFGGDDNVLEIYIGYLRKKLEADGLPRLIQTVRGVGYVLREE